MESLDRLPAELRTGAPTISALIATLLALVLAEVIFQAEEYNYEPGCKLVFLALQKGLGQKGQKGQKGQTAQEALRGTFISAATLCAVFVYIIELVCFFLLRRGSTGNEASARGRFFPLVLPAFRQCFPRRRCLPHHSECLAQ